MTLVHLTVLRTERLSPHWMRVTLGGGEIERFTYRGYDHWFRLFLPLGGEEGLERIPKKANTLMGYLRYLRIPDGVRPVMRNYTVAGYRGGAAPEIDVDFVLHGLEDGTAGPAARWADAAQPGESVVILDEGTTVGPISSGEVLLVCDETGLPAVASVLASLPEGVSATAIIEAPGPEDVRDLDAPSLDAANLDAQWLIRQGERPGSLALAALENVAVTEHTRVFIVGEQQLATQGRRHLVARGVPKANIRFSGYWKLGAASPTPKAQAAGRSDHPTP